MTKVLKTVCISSYSWTLELFKGYIQRLNSFAINKPTLPSKIQISRDVH